MISPFTIETLEFVTSISICFLFSFNILTILLRTTSGALPTFIESKEKQ